MKQSISVTIDADIIELLDTMIKSNKFRNRSHALEYLLDKGIEQTKKR